MSIGTGNFIEPETSIKAIEEVEEYLQYHNIQDVNEIIGKVQMN